MGLFDWIGDRTGLHVGHALQQAGHAVGGVLDNKWTKGGLAAALAASGVGTPMAMMLMGGEGLLGGALHEGGGLRDAVSSGVKGAGYGALAGSAGQALRSAFAPSSAGASFGAGSASPGAAEAFSGPGMMTAPAASGASSAAGGGLASTLKTIGGFAKDNPNAIGMGLQGVGGLASAGSENALRHAQADQLAAQTRSMQNEEEEKKRRAAALQPLLAALMGNMGKPVAPNPYG